MTVLNPDAFVAELRLYGFGGREGWFAESSEVLEKGWRDGVGRLVAFFAVPGMVGVDRFLVGPGAPSPRSSEALAGFG